MHCEAVLSWHRLESVVFSLGLKSDVCDIREHSVLGMKWICQFPSAGRLIQE